MGLRCPWSPASRAPPARHAGTARLVENLFARSGARGASPLAGRGISEDAPPPFGTYKDRKGFLGNPFGFECAMGQTARMQFTERSQRVIRCAIEVRRPLGPGLPESTDEQGLAHELKPQGLAFLPQHSLPVACKGLRLDRGHRVDIVADNQTIPGLKREEHMPGIHEARRPAPGNRPVSDMAS